MWNETMAGCCCKKKMISNCLILDFFFLNIFHFREYFFHCQHFFIAFIHRTQIAKIKQKAKQSLDTEL